MRVVSPYKPFVADNPPHLELGPFDWDGALSMMAESVRRACGGMKAYAITDTDTPISIPAFRYQTHETRLMLWIVEVILAYLSSDEFDQDTIMVSPDTLVYRDIRSYFVKDLTLLVRSAPHYASRPILNSVQWWAFKSKRRLIALYTDVLEMAKTLPDDQLEWGADTEPLRRLMMPIELGIQFRHGLKVWMLESDSVMQSLSAAVCAQIDAGDPVSPPARPIVDFKFLRKKWMSRYFDATLGQVVTP